MYCKKIGPPLDIANCNVFFVSPSSARAGRCALRDRLMPRQKKNVGGPSRPVTFILMPPDLKNPLSHVGRQVGIPGARVNPNSISVEVEVEKWRVERREEEPLRC